MFLLSRTYSELDLGPANWHTWRIHRKLKFIYQWTLTSLNTEFRFRPSSRQLLHRGLQVDLNYRQFIFYNPSRTKAPLIQRKITSSISCKSHYIFYERNVLGPYCSHLYEQFLVMSRDKKYLGEPARHDKYIYWSRENSSIKLTDLTSPKKLVDERIYVYVAAKNIPLHSLYILFCSLL